MQLIEDWKAKLWKLWSIRLAAVYAAITAAIVANPELLLGLVSFVPPEYRQLAAVVIGGLVFGVPTLNQLMHRPASGETPDV